MKRALESSTIARRDAEAQFALFLSRVRPEKRAGVTVDWAVQHYRISRKRAGEMLGVGT